MVMTRMLGIAVAVALVGCMHHATPGLSLGSRVKTP